MTDNERIAKFMGHVTDYTTDYPDDTSQRVVWYTDKRLTADQLRYDSSWDWLMPVVEKIRTLSGTKDRLGYKIDLTAFGISHLTIWAELPTVYKEALEFIKWFETKETHV